LGREALGMEPITSRMSRGENTLVATNCHADLRSCGFDSED